MKKTAYALMVLSELSPARKKLALRKKEWHIKNSHWFSGSGLG